MKLMQLLKLGRSDRLLTVTILFSSLLTYKSAEAQVIPDATMPGNSIVNSSGNTIIINGGTTIGNNLFHSFREFSIPTGNTALFNNNISIQNIFSRVTGNSLSNIDGIIKANGNANLFLLNPNGITFEKNAQLNIGGSFIGSTANSIKFSEGEFSAIAPSAPPLLTVNVPIGLQFGANPGTIINRSQASPISTTNNESNTLQASNSIRTPAGLQVLPGKTLALIGGELKLEGGNITTFGGRIEVGSVDSYSLVNLSAIDTNSPDKGFSFGYAGIQNFRDINLSQQAVIDASGVIFPDGPNIAPIIVNEGNSGTIQVFGRNINLDSAAIVTSNAGIKPGGNLTITASNSLQVSGLVNAPIDPSGQLPAGLFTQSFSSGISGNLEINAKQLTITNQAQISTAAYDVGSAGNLTIKTTDFIKLTEKAGISSQAQAPAIGNGGNLTIETGQLTVENSQIGASTFGLGNAGNLRIKAADSVIVTGEIKDNGNIFSSGIFAQVGRPFNLPNGKIFYPTGNGGNLTVETGGLILQNGGQISARNRGLGSAGNLTVIAAKYIEISGKTSDGKETSGLFALTEGGRNAGDLKVTTPQLNVRDGGVITVSGKGEGAAGNINIFSPKIQLENQGSFNATTAAGGSGNIDIKSQDLRLRSNSNITTDATQGTANGGNITINTNTLTTLENSDIVAKAVAGRGGNIFINLQGIFLSRDSDINASSQKGINGVVEIQRPEVDPIQGIVKSGENPINAQQLITLGCDANQGENSSSYINTGKGGLDTNPTDRLRPNAIWDDNRSVVNNNSDRSISVTSTFHTSTPPDRTKSEAIVEAQGWVWKPNSNKTVVTLTTKPSKINRYTSWQKAINCYGK